MIGTSNQISPRLSHLQQGTADVFVFENKYRVAGTVLLAITTPISVYLMMKFFSDVVIVQSRTWFDVLYFIIAFFLVSYLFRSGIFTSTGKPAGRYCIESSDKIYEFYRFLRFKLIVKTWPLNKITCAEVCHRDDGKTYGVGSFPAPGQFFVRLRLQNTTHMLTDWIDEIEAKAIAGAINQRLEKTRRQAA